MFGCFRLDIAERLLLASGKAVPLTPKVFDLLVLLAQHPGELLEKDFILGALWPNTFVEEANLSVNVSTLRRALESAGGSHYIETVPKRGYRFAVEVQAIYGSSGRCHLGMTDSEEIRQLFGLGDSDSHFRVVLSPETGHESILPNR